MQEFVGWAVLVLLLFLIYRAVGRLAYHEPELTAYREWDESMKRAWGA